MKKLILFGFVVLLSFTIGISNISAQCPTPAPNDYPGVPFIGPFIDQVESPAGSGCFMFFEYCWRVTPWNGGEVEIYIGAQWAGPGCSGIWNINDVVRDASRKIIRDLHPWTTTASGTGAPFTPIIPPCTGPNGEQQLSNTIYRILSASCYSTSYFNGNATLRTPCGDGNEGRCEEGWRLCWETLPNGDVVLKETIISRINNGATCPATVYIPLGPNGYGNITLPCVLECK